MSNFDNFNRNKLFANTKASTANMTRFGDAASKVNRTSLENVRENINRIDINKMPKPKETPKVVTNNSVNKTQNMRNINLNSNFNRKSW